MKEREREMRNVLRRLNQVDKNTLFAFVVLSMPVSMVAAVATITIQVLLK
jgi:hypothetical protein